MRFVVSLKAVLLFGLIVALPLLALPVAARLIDARLNGSPPLSLATAPLAENGGEAVALPMMVGRVSPAELADASGGDLIAGLDAPGAPPPAPTSFDPLWTEPVAPAAVEEEIQIDDRTVARLQQIRQRLEELGAEYVVVETTDSGGRFRFHCRMNVDANSPFTRPFESVSRDPLAAGEQVLHEVEAWRLAAAESRVRQE